MRQLLPNTMRGSRSTSSIPGMRTKVVPALLGSVLGVAGAASAFGQEHVPASDADLELQSFAANSAFAEAMTTVADIDGDGWRDIAVGALAHDPLDPEGLPINNAGGVAIFSGQTGALLRLLEGRERDANLGAALIEVADRNGDGTPELLVTAPRMSSDFDAEVGGFIIFSGATGDVLEVVRGDLGAGTTLGSSAAALGDLNGDGMDDFVVGASGVGAGDPSPGYAVVMDAATLTPLRVLVGESAGSIFGRSVAGVDDVNGDGIQDVLVGAPLQEVADPAGGPDFLDAGRAYLFSGADLTLLGAFERYTTPTDTPKANFGNAVAGLGDLDGDGFGDFAVGAPEGQQGSGGNGAVTVFSGATGDVLYDIEGAFATGEQHGVSVAGVGDLDGDGTPDFAAGSAQVCFGFCTSREGQVIVYSGASGAVIRYYDGADIGDTFGSAIAAADIDGNGAADLLAAAPFHATGPDGPGSVYVFLGAASGLPADVDGDGAVGVSDLLAVLAAWGDCPDCPEDIDGDGVVAVSDLLAVLAGWTG